MKDRTPSYLEIAVEAAQAATRVAVDGLNRPLAVSRKGFRDIVTEADFAAQDAAVKVIHTQWPDAAVLGEENLTPEGEADTVWVIDPIDGTTNYARHLPIFCVSIGVVQHGQPIVGVVYDPLHDHLFTAERGLGANLNRSSIHVSTIHTIGDAILGLDWGRQPDVRQRAVALLDRISTRCGTVRAIGSAALAMCYLAAGWIDLYYNLSLKPWDGAATQIIVSEAGGCITNPQGGSWDYTQPAVFASNGLIHSEFGIYGVED